MPIFKMLVPLFQATMKYFKDSESPKHSNSVTTRCTDTYLKIARTIFFANTLNILHAKPYSIFKSLSVPSGFIFKIFKVQTCPLNRPFLSVCYHASVINLKLVQSFQLY